VARGAAVPLNGRVADTIAADALLGLLLPFWQLVLGGVIIVFVFVASVRLARRGRSRMNTAIIVTGAAVISLVVIGVLAS
jgi:uncharacterized Tic20 family protein